MVHRWRLTIDDCLRNWDDPGRMESRPSSRRRAKRDAAGQSPSRNGQAPRKGRLRHYEYSKVILTRSLLFLPTVHPPFHLASRRDNFTV